MGGRDRVVGWTLTLWSIVAWATAGGVMIVRNPNGLGLLALVAAVCMGMCVTASVYRDRLR